MTASPKAEIVTATRINGTTRRNNAMSIRANGTVRNNSAIKIIQIMGTKKMNVMDISTYSNEQNYNSQRVCAELSACSPLHCIRTHLLTHLQQSIQGLQILNDVFGKWSRT